MASPIVQELCCMYVKNESNSNDLHQDSRHVVISNFALSIIAASLSILGVIYQLRPRPPAHTLRTPREVDSFQRQNSIICWLAVADLLASIGILIRSSVWISNNLKFMDFADMNNRLFCAVISGWIQYWYISTYFWTLCYTVDVYRICNGKESLQWLYYLLSWVVTAVLCICALVPLYLPSMTHCTSKIGYRLPHYLITYLPMLLVMIINPILYAISSQSIRQSLRSRGLYTDQERSVISNVKQKFRMVILVFYVCWLTNIVDVIWRLTGIYYEIGGKYDAEGLHILWNLMSFLNPLQGFLNSLVYRNFGGCRMCIEPEQSAVVVLPRYRQRRADIQQSMTTSFEDSMERAPLLSFRRT